MESTSFLLLLFCVVGVRVGADDLRQEVTELFQSFKTQLERQYADLASRLSMSETKISELELQKAELQKHKEEQQSRLDCVRRRLCERDGFTYADGVCYYISTEQKNWDDSRQWCLDRDSDLIIIKSKEKQDLVASFNKRIWLGLNDKVTEGIFKWVDGTSLTTPTYWLSGQPDWEKNDPPKHHTNIESDCVEYYVGSESTAPSNGWNDLVCSLHKTYWMCERSLC